MHISEGVLSAPVLVGGAALAAAGTALGLRRVDYDRLVTVAILSAAFFVGSLIRVPLGPSAAHLILNGLAGLACSSLRVVRPKSPDGSGRSTCRCWKPNWRARQSAVF